MAKEKSTATFSEELVNKRLDVMKKFFEENKEFVKKWEEMKLEWETAKFKRDYIKKNEPWKEDPQLTLFGD